MALAFKRIMIVTHNVQFAIDTKRALEHLGDYAVTIVTDSTNALDTLRNQAHNLVLVDVENLDLLAPDMIQAIRTIQNEIAILLAPDLPDVHDVAIIAKVQGVVDIPAPIRSLIPILESSVRDVYDALPDTAKAPAVYTLQDTVYIETLVDELLEDDETPYFTSRQIRAQKKSITDPTDSANQPSNALEVVIESNPDGDTVHYVAPQDTERHQSPAGLFQRLAEEEPPMPKLGESGTVRDLARSVTQSNHIEPTNVDADDEPDDTLDENDDDGNAIPAMLVLQTALNQTTPIEAISLQTLYDNIHDLLPPEKQTIRPLPSWVKEGEKFIREPVFLQDSLITFDTQRPMEYTSTTTQPSDSAEVISNTGDLETEAIDKPPPYAIDDIQDIGELAAQDSTLEGERETTTAEGETGVDSAIESDETRVEESVDTPAQLDIVDPDDDDSASYDPDIDELMVDDVPESKIQTDDPYIAQLAVTLTQVTTELTAEATILTRDNVIVAYSGDMPMEDIEDLRDVIGDDWKASLDNARIRFITLPSSGKDYMLYSKGTVSDFTLSMIFIGTKQLRIIRRQGQRLTSALEATSELETSLEPVPDIAVTEEPKSVPEIETPIEPEALPEIESPQSEETPIFEDQALVTENETLSPQDVIDIDSGEESSEDSEPIDVGPRLPYTFIWLVNDLNIQLSEDVAKKLVFWLDVQLNSLHWIVHKLDVHQDFIYLYADVPGDLSPSELIRGLMQRTEKIARSEDESLPEALWADAYLVLTPGREMTDREIQRFLNFAQE